VQHKLEKCRRLRYILVPTQAFAVWAWPSRSCHIGSGHISDGLARLWKLPGIASLMRDFLTVIMDWTDASTPTQRDCLASVPRDKKEPRNEHVSVSLPIARDNCSVVSRQSGRCPRKVDLKSSSTLISDENVVCVRGFFLCGLKSAAACRHAMSPCGRTRTACLSSAPCNV